MRTDTAPTDAGRQYLAAHAAHYATKDLHEALRLYRGVMVAHPNTQEAEYSRTQILNIVNSVVPKQELLDAQAELALAHLKHETPPDVEPAPTTTLPSEPPGQRKAARSPGESI
jgi:hypothetical protein